jgi:hypothetical protein
VVAPPDADVFFAPRDYVTLVGSSGPPGAPVDEARGRARRLGEDGVELCAYKDGDLLVDVGLPPAGREGARDILHTGARGSVGWADLDRRIGAALCLNRMFGAPAEPPPAALG